jgi:hypothetical protein
LLLPEMPRPAELPSRRRALALMGFHPSRALADPPWSTLPSTSLPALQRSRVSGKTGHCLCREVLQHGPVRRTVASPSALLGFLTLSRPGCPSGSPGRSGTSRRTSGARGVAPL